MQLRQLDLHLTALVSEQIDLFQRQLLCLTLLKQHLNHLRAAQTVHNILKRHFDVVFNVLLPTRGFKVQQVLTIGRRSLVTIGPQRRHKTRILSEAFYTRCPASLRSLRSQRG